MKNKKNEKRETGGKGKKKKKRENEKMWEWEKKIGDENWEDGENG